MISRILLFLKAPWAGFVKTRIGRTAGHEEALRVYRWLVERQLKALPDFAKVEIHFAPENAATEMKEWLGNEFFYYPQCEGDLGDRMREAVKSAFSRGRGPVICIGADCPTLMSQDICDAISFLKNGADLVFGPTHDGGYYLLGLKGFQPEIFRQIPWSSEQTLEVSLERAGEAGLNVELLSRKSDIDEASDWEAFCRESRLLW